MFEIFRTKKPEKTTLLHEQWKKMVDDPTSYAIIGLKVDHQVDSSGGTELFSPGSALDTAQKVTTYATRKLEQAAEYGVYTAQRDQQFKDEKLTIKNT